MSEKIYLDNILYKAKPSKHAGESDKERKARKKAKADKKKGISACHADAMDDMFDDIKKEKKQARKEAERRYHAGFYDPTESFGDW